MEYRGGDRCIGMPAISGTLEKNKTRPCMQKTRKQNGKRSNSNNKIHTNKLKKKGHAKTTMPHGAILWQIITKKLLLSSTERRRSNN